MPPLKCPAVDRSGLAVGEVNILPRSECSELPHCVTQSLCVQPPPSPGRWGRAGGLHGCHNRKQRCLHLSAASASSLLRGPELLPGPKAPFPSLPGGEMVPPASLRQTVGSFSSLLSSPGQCPDLTGRRRWAVDRKVRSALVHSRTFCLASFVNSVGSAESPMCHLTQAASRLGRDRPPVSAGHGCSRCFCTQVRGPAADFRTRSRSRREGADLELPSSPEAPWTRLQSRLPRCPPAPAGRVGEPLGVCGFPSGTCVFSRAGDQQQSLSRK